jgi:hypothetical protein
MRNTVNYSRQRRCAQKRERTVRRVKTSPCKLENRFFISSLATQTKSFGIPASPQCISGHKPWDSRTKTRLCCACWNSISLMSFIRHGMQFNSKTKIKSMNSVSQQPPQITKNNRKRRIHTKITQNQSPFFLLHAFDLTMTARGVLRHTQLTKCSQQTHRSKRRLCS